MGWDTSTGSIFGTVISIDAFDNRCTFLLIKITSFCFVVLFFRAAGLFFFSAFLINLLAGIVFLLGTNVAIVCDGLSDYKLLQKVSSF